MDFDSDAEDELSSLQPDEAAGFVEPVPYVSETAREIEEIQVVSETRDSTCDGDKNSFPNPSYSRRCS